MPLSVSCVCGKQFKVFEDLAGTDVRCQVCGKMCRVGVAEPEPALEAYDPNIPDDGSTKTCPACAEKIPKRARTCPMCKEVLMDSPEKLGEDERAAVIAGVIEGIRQQPASLDAELAGGFLSGKSIALIVFFGLSVVMIFAGMAQRQGGGLVAIGITFGIILGIPLIVSLVNDSKASHIQDAPTAQEALSRYMMAVKTGRARKAYAALVPASRSATSVETIRFKNPKIANEFKILSYDDAKSFGKYWKHIFVGPSSNTRTVTLSKFKSDGRSANGIEVVKATMSTTSYSSLIVVLVLLGIIGIILAVIIIAASQQKEERIIRKSLIQHNGRWYILDGSLEGELDKVI